MRILGLIVIVVCPLAVNTTAAVRAQTLDHMRRQVREPAASPSSTAPPVDNTDDDDEDKRPQRHRPAYQGEYCDNVDDQDTFESFLGDIFLLGVSSPFLVPRAALKDTGTDGYFPDHPYDGETGSLTYNSKSPGAHDSLVVLQTDFGTDFDALSHGHARATGELVSRFGIDTEIFYRHEDLPIGSDSLWHGDANLTYRFAQNEHLQFRVGAGVNWFNDTSGSEVGFNTTYGADWFPADPWMVSSTLDLGRHGDSSLVHFRNTVGVTHNGWGVFTGHDYFRLGSLTINAWINGIEYRF